MQTTHRIAVLIARLGIAAGLLLSSVGGTWAAPPKSHTTPLVTQAPATQAPGDLSSTAWDKIVAQLPQSPLTAQAAAAAESLHTSQAAKLTASDGAASDYFGHAVAISGDIVVVGADYDDDNGTNSGAAYVFYRNEGGADAWGQVAKLLASDGAESDSFGDSVAIDGDTIVVGAYHDDDNNINAGSAYVFQRNEGGADAWGQVAKLIAPDGAYTDYFGSSVSISGDIIVAGAEGDDELASNAGAVYVFARNLDGANAWGQVAKLTAADGAANDYLGGAVAVSGDTIVAGAYYDDDKGASSGSAYIFYRNTDGADAWGQAAKLTAGDGAESDLFGFAVAISGDTVVAAAPWDDDNGETSGSAYVFARNQGGADAWGQVAKLTASDGATDDSFGKTLSISGDVIVAGAGGDDNDNGGNAGSVYLFERNAGGADAWGQAAKLTADDGTTGDFLGSAVFVSGNALVAGGHGDENYTGVAYVFARAGNAWEQAAKPLAEDGESGDMFGWAAAASGDTAVVGALDDDDSAGSAYVLTRTGNTWGQVVKLTADYTATDDYFGRAVGISGDTVVVAAYGDDDVGSFAGAAYVFERNTGGADAWGQAAMLTASDGAAGDFFGRAVAISGDTLVVGADGDDDGGAMSGSAYIFQRNQGGADAWGQVAKLAAADGAAYDHFGSAAAISGDTVVIGAYCDDDAGGSSGSAYVFQRNQGGADGWGQMAILTAGVDAAAYDYFGEHVAISQDTIFIGAYHDDDTNPAYGSVYVFERNEGGADAWGQAAKIAAPGGTTYDCFSCALAASGDTLAVGAYQDDEQGSNAGAAYVFARNEGGADAWGQLAKLTASDGADYDYFGKAVALGDNTVIVGANQDDDNGSNSGSAYVYQWEYVPPADLVLSASVTPTTAAPGERITYTLAFSNAGGDPATGVVITDPIPAGVVGTSFISSGPVITQVSGSRYAWNVPDLAAGEGGLITVTGVVKVPLAAGVLTNTASITTTSTDSDPGNNASGASLIVPNVAPVANDATHYVSEDDILSGNLSASDPNGDAISYTLATAAVSGTVLVNAATGKFAYMPTNSLASYIDHFGYVVTDTGALSATAAVTIQVTAYDDPPSVSNIPNQPVAVSAPAGPISFTVGDPDTPLDELTLNSASSYTELVQLANITFGGSGPSRTVTLTPTTGMTGTATITVTVQDGACSPWYSRTRQPTYHSECGYDVFVLAVGAVNSPPEFASTPPLEATEDITYTYAITADDLDAGDILTITVITRPAWLFFVDHHDRTATLGGIPGQAAVGEHAVALRVRDNKGAVAFQAFTVTVANVNDPPVARDNTYVTTENIPRSLNVLANDIDPDGDPISLEAVGTPIFGSASISGTNVLYTPTNRIITYTDSFSYILSDGVLTDTAVVTVTVVADDDPPAISNIPYQVTGAGVPVGPLPFSVGDPDTPLEELTLDGASSNPALVPEENITFGGSGANRTVTITPTAGVSSTAVITITVGDGSSSDYASFLLIALLNNPPEFTSAPAVSATEDIAYTYAITATDPDARDKLIITAPSLPAWLTLVDHGDRTASLDGTPTYLDVGEHAVILRVRDTKGATATQAFTITVANVDEPPLAVDDTADTNEDTPASIDILANDDDPDDRPLSLEALGAPVYGSITISGTLVRYTPTNRTAPYTDTFTYTLSNGVLSDTAVVTVTVEADDDPPAISNISNQLSAEGVPVGPLPFSLSDPDTPLDALSLDKASSNTALVPLENITLGGSVGNRTVTITPTAGVSGTAIITLTAGDGSSFALDSFVLSVDVNSPPEFTSEPPSAATEDSAYSYLITAADLDAGDTLTITATSLPAWLTLVDYGDRTASLDGTPANSDVGEHAVALQVQDPQGATAAQAFTITVTATPIVVGKAITWTGTLSTDWSNPANWDDAVPTLLDSVLIPGSAAGGHWPVVDVVTAACKSLVIASGAYLTVTSGMTLGVEGGLVNSGTLALQQVNGSPSQFHVRNTAGDVVYYGLAITPTTGYSLGLTTVTIKGNRDCTTHDPGDTVDRCFEISPTHKVTATVAFYYLDGERESFDPAGMQAWRWDTAAMTWTQAGSAAAWGSASGGWWVEVSGMSAYDSAYVLRGDLTHPAALELRALRVGGRPARRSVPVGLFTVGAILLGVACVAIRRRKMRP